MEPSLDLIEPVNFPLYEFSPSESEATPLFLYKIGKAGKYQKELI